MIMFIRSNKAYFGFGLVLAFLSFFLSCAQQVAPQGGPKDLTAPYMVKSMPSDQSLNFRGQKIKLYFDEYIKVQKPKDNIMFSPPLANIKDVYVLGKTLIIDLKDSLKSNYTYELLLNDAVKDENEGNVLKQQKLSFSTGPTIDSLTIEGKLIDYLTNEPVSNAFIVLHTDTLDSLLYNTFPVYASKTNPEGNFSFNNLKAGQYAVFALGDKNYSLKFDIVNESVGFLNQRITVGNDSLVIDTQLVYARVHDSLSMDTLLQVDTLIDSIFIQSIKPIELLFFQEAKTNFYIKKIKARNIAGRVIQYFENIDSFSVQCLNPAVSFTSESFIGTDSFRLWQTSLLSDTVSYAIKINGSFLDTISIFQDSLDTLDERDRIILRQKLGVSWQNIKPNIRFDYKPRIYFSAPVKTILYDSIKWYVNKDSAIAVKMILDTSRMFLEANYDWQENKRYKCFIPDSVFVDFFARTNDTIEFESKTRLFKAYGQVNLIIKDSLERDFIINYKKGKEVIKQFHTHKDSVAISIPYVQPGPYSLQFIHDKDHNNKWSTGKLSEKKQPERFYDYPVELNVKGGFDVFQEINLSKIVF